MLTRNVSYYQHTQHTRLLCNAVDRLCDKLQKISITQSTIASTGGSDYASCDPFKGGYFTFSSVQFKIV